MMGPNDDFDPEYDIEPSNPSIQLPMLPTLTGKPIAFPGCCVGLSAPLLAHLHTLLPPSPSLILSIGSGYGLLEALLLADPFRLNVIGVEVTPSPNRFIPAIHHRTVPGTRFLDPLAADATAWLFVYPRRSELLEEYLSTYGEGKLEKLVWIGPTADWEDYKRFFGKGWGVQVNVANEIGGRAWELIVIASKLPT